jgi:hypothetical protein
MPVQALQFQAMPYRTLSDNYSACACSLSLSTMLLCSIFYKYVSLTELPGIVSRMSLEQQADASASNARTSFASHVNRRTRRTNGIWLQFSCSTKCTASCSLERHDLRLRRSCVIGSSIHSAGALRRKHLMEARASRARRLRHLSDGTEVVLPPLEEHKIQLDRLDLNADELGPLYPLAGPFHVFLSHNWKHGYARDRKRKLMLPVRFQQFRVWHRL